jgi:hypothetical protein
MIPVIITTATVVMPNDFSTWQDVVVLFFASFLSNFILDSVLGKYNS